MSVSQTRVAGLSLPFKVSGIQGSPRRFLFRLRRLALRRRVWHSALTLPERGILELTARFVERVRSGLLRRTLEGIVGKLASMLESWFLTKVARRGLRLARGMVDAAVVMGYWEARAWLGDRVYVRFLGVKACHEPFGGSSAR